MSDWLKKIFNSKPEQQMPFFNSMALMNAIAEGEKMFKAVLFAEFPNHWQGAHSVTKEHGEEMAGNASKSNLNVLIDFGHESLWNPKAPAAGWCDKTKIDVRDDGLYLPVPEFTPTAQEMIRNKELLGLSSAYNTEVFDPFNNRIGAVLWSMALTNTPNFPFQVDHIPDIMNSRKFFFNSFHQEEEPMKFKNEQLLDWGFTQEEIDAGLNEDQVADKVNAKLAEAAPSSETSPAAPAAPAEQPAAAANAGASAEDPLANSPAVMALIEKVDGIVGDQKKGRERDIGLALNAKVEDFTITKADADAIWKPLFESDYEGTLAKLNARPKGSARPGSVAVSEDGKEQAKTNSFEQRIVDFKAECAAARA